MPAEHDVSSGDLIRTVELLVDVFAARSSRYAVVGGLATLLRARPRFTQDVEKQNADEEEFIPDVGVSSFVTGKLGP